MGNFKFKGSYVFWGLVFIAILWGVGSYNGLVNGRQDTEAQWGHVQTSYQRRNDFIPNVVASVKAYATHEQGTLTGAIEARAKASSIIIDPSNATPEQLQAFTEAQKKVQGEFSQALSRLMVVQEQYPELKANLNFQALQDQLEGTENRINTERHRFNVVANAYDKSIENFPGIIIAKIFGFKKIEYFKAEEGADKAPKVEF
ncbi:MAG: LemA family protein [Candidatus Peribacteria bacterium]|jgi:LemA protein|nr:LemA family protein [Candidatus Peribacteria bacterium]